MQNVLYLSIVTTQHKTRQRCVRRLVMNIGAYRSASAQDAY